MTNKARTRRGRTGATPGPAPAAGDRGTGPLGPLLAVRPWHDPVIDRLGHDPRSWYVETFWLGTLGPSTTWLMRSLAAGLEESPGGFTLSVPDTARGLGIGTGGGASSTFARALQRAVHFDLARFDGDGTLAVRRRVPPLGRWQVDRLPAPLRERHEEWQRARSEGVPVESMRRRSRQLALSLLELGEDLESTERQLLRWRYHPALAHESAAWAWSRHLAAARAAAEGAQEGGVKPLRSSMSVRTPKPVPPLVR